MKKTKVLGITLLISSCFVGSLQAGSFYSSKGIGLVYNFISGRSVGMGGVGIATMDNMTLNYLNPAALVEVPFTFISGNFLHEATDLKGSGQDASIATTGVAGVQFLIPIKRNRAVISLGVNPYSSIEYAFSSLGTEEGKSYVETVSGDGGVNTGFISFSFRPIKNLSLGVTGLFYFGVLKNTWKINFLTTDFFNTRDQISQSFATGSFRVGFIYNITSGWSLGGVYTPAVTLDLNKKLKERFNEFTDFPDSDFEIPLAFGVGTAINLGKKLVTGVDYYFQKWSDLQREGYVNDSRRIGFGLEYSGRGDFRSSFFSRMAIRLGFFYRDLGLEDPIGEKVIEKFGTIGLGMPIRWGLGRIDLALEVGRRGSISKNPFQETVIRVTGSVSVGERWFFRGGRR
jgi:hypothetical protein